MSVYVSEDFDDYDEMTVLSGTYENADIIRMGYAGGRANWFWNIIQNGKVIAVTVGYPKYAYKEAQR